MVADRLFVRARSPLRISFAGGGTDIPAYYMERGGAVLVATVDKYSYVSLVPQSNHAIRLVSLDYDIDVRYEIKEQPALDGVLDLAKAVVRRFDVSTGFELVLQSDAPPGSGLGSSSSMTVAIIGALLEWLRGRASVYEIAELAYEIERVDLGISGGRQDQYAAAFGGMNYIGFSNRGVVVTPLRIRQDMLNDLEAHLLLCYTGQTRLSSGLIDRQINYYKSGRPETLEGMRELHALCDEMRDALVCGKLGWFGELLGHAAAAKKKMNPETTDARIDALASEAIGLGAVSAKILGAGGGGYLLLFTPIDRKKAVRRRLEEMGAQFVSFSFDSLGLQSWASTCP